MANLITTSAAIVTLLASGGVFATPIAGLYNTGVDNSGAVLTAGSVGTPVTDSHYTVSTNVPSNITLPADYNTGASTSIGSNIQAVVASNANDYYIPSAGTASGATGSWIPAANSTASAWLTPLANPTTSLDPNKDGTYIYQTTFSINTSQYNLSTATLSGQWAADNYGTLYLNGNIISTISNPRNLSPQQPDGVAYNSWTSFTAASVPNKDFVSGVNTLTFVVGNIAQNGGNPTGVRAEFTSSISNISPVPEPTEGALLLSGVGLLGFIAARRSKTA
jgi:hypothetical protein